MDDDEPLNLSTKSNRSNSNAIIWSPASICEKESSGGGGDGLSIKEELDNLKTELMPMNSQSLLGGSSSTSSSSPSCISNASSIRTNVSQSTIPIHEFLEKAHANTISAEFFQKLQQRRNTDSQNICGGGAADFTANHFGLTNKIDFPSTLTQAAAAAAAAAAAVQAATNSEFLTHLKQAEIDLIAKNQVSIYQGEYHQLKKNYFSFFSFCSFFYALKSAELHKEKRFKSFLSSDKFN